MLLYAYVYDEKNVLIISIINLVYVTLLFLSSFSLVVKDGGKRESPCEVLDDVGWEGKDDKQEQWILNSAATSKLTNLNIPFLQYSNASLLHLLPHNFFSPLRPSYDKVFSRLS